MSTDYQLTEKGEAALRDILGTVAELIGPPGGGGFPAGELYAMLMPLVKTLDTFEKMMSTAARLGLVEKRGQLYFRKEMT